MEDFENFKIQIAETILNPQYIPIKLLKKEMDSTKRVLMSVLRNTTYDSTALKGVQDECRRLEDFSTVLAHEIADDIIATYLQQMRASSVLNMCNMIVTTQDFCQAPAPDILIGVLAERIECAITSAAIDYQSLTLKQSTDSYRGKTERAILQLLKQAYDRRVEMEP